MSCLSLLEYARESAGCGKATLQSYLVERRDAGQEGSWTAVPLKLFVPGGPACRVFVPLLCGLLLKATPGPRVVYFFFKPKFPQFKAWSESSVKNFFSTGIKYRENLSM